MTDRESFYRTVFLVGAAYDTILEHCFPCVETDLRRTRPSTARTHRISPHRDRLHFRAGTELLVRFAKHHSKPRHGAGWHRLQGHLHRIVAYYLVIGQMIHAVFTLVRCVRSRFSWCSSSRVCGGRPPLGSPARERVAADGSARFTSDGIGAGGATTNDPAFARRVIRLALYQLDRARTRLDTRNRHARCAPQRWSQSRAGVAY